jgi:endonuclease-3
LGQRHRRARRHDPLAEYLQRQQLRRELPRWDQVADAPTETVERWIRTAGLSRIKAPRIQTILRRIRAERGRISLEFLRGYTPEDAAAYLRAFAGIGPKTVNCVLLFAFAMPVFPVDTHIHRIALRAGWLPTGTSAERAHDLLTPLIPPPDRYEMHVLLIRRGRQTCKAARPRCADCRLASVCAYGLRHAPAKPR